MSNFVSDSLSIHPPSIQNRFGMKESCEIDILEALVIFFMKGAKPAQFLVVLQNIYKDGTVI